MELMVNDLSLDGQFNNLDSFRNAIERLVELRTVADRHGRNVYCHRNLAHSRVSRDLSFPQALNQALDRNKQRAIMQWLTRQGPFWEDSRIHSPDDWFEVDGRLVTDSAIGEAAGSILAGIDKRLISLTPSAWLISPIMVTWAASDAMRKDISVINYWEADKLETSLVAAPTRITSWSVLRDLTISRCRRLSFSENAFSHLEGHPFNEAAANRLFFLIKVLNRFSECFNENGERTEEGHRLYQDFFTGKKPLRCFKWVKANGC